MSNVVLKEGINWVGVVDWNIRDFHGYTTNRGTSYNAYLIRDEKIALIDTVKHSFADELARNIAELMTSRKSTTSSLTMWKWTTQAAARNRQALQKRQNHGFPTGKRSPD